MAVFLCDFAAVTLMNLPVMALRPMPRGFRLEELLPVAMLFVF